MYNIKILIYLLTLCCGFLASSQLFAFASAPNYQESIQSIQALPSPIRGPHRMIPLRQVAQLAGYIPGLSGRPAKELDVVTSAFPNLSRSEILRILDKVQKQGIVQAGNFISPSLPSLSMCSCTSVELRILTILGQLDEIVVLHPNKMAKLVYTAFAEEGLLQTFLFALSLEELGYQDLSLNIIAPGLTDTQAYSEKLRQLQKIPIISRINKYSSGSDYIRAVAEGASERSHSFDMIDPDGGFGERIETRISKDQWGDYNEIAIDDVADVERGHNGDTPLFKIYLSKTASRKWNVTCGANTVALGRSCLYSRQEHTRFITTEEAAPAGKDVAESFCQLVQASVEEAPSQMEAIINIMQVRDTLVKEGVLKNRMFYAHARRPYDQEVYSLPIYLSHGAEPDFEEMVDRTATVDPVIYVLKNKTIQKHFNSYRSYGLVWDERFEIIKQAP